MRTALAKLFRALGGPAEPRWMLIGGFAFAHHGVPHWAADIDLIAADETLCEGRIPYFGYRKLAASPVAARFRHAEVVPDLDLLIVPQEVLDAFWHRSVSSVFGLRVPAIGDLIALCEQAATIDSHQAERMNDSAHRLCAIGGDNRVPDETLIDSQSAAFAEHFTPVSYVMHREDCWPLPAKLGQLPMNA